MYIHCCMYTNTKGVGAIRTSPCHSSYSKPQVPLLLSWPAPPKSALHQQPHPLGARTPPFSKSLLALGLQRAPALSPSRLPSQPLVGP